MQRTKIDWVKNQDGSQGYTINPIKGLCKGGCSYCYARRIYTRYKLDPTIRLDLRVFDKLPKKPSRIFVCSTHDIMGDWISRLWVRFIIREMRVRPRYTFFLLTKFPENHCNFIFPDNCWLGVTITGSYIKEKIASFYIEHPNKFISFEPLLQLPQNIFIPDDIKWIIIGAQTQPLKLPKYRWIELLCEEARDMKIPIFMKSNLKKVWGENLIQEFPKGV